MNTPRISRHFGITAITLIVVTGSLLIAHDISSQHTQQREIAAGHGDTRPTLLLTEIGGCTYVVAHERNSYSTGSIGLSIVHHAACQNPAHAPSPRP